MGIFRTVTGGILLFGMLFALTTIIAPVKAAVWSDNGMDMGIGVLGLQPKPGQSKTIVKGLYERQESYNADQRKAISGLELRRQPYDTHPVIGKFEFSEDGSLGIQTDNEFYTVHESGLELGDGTTGLIVQKIQGNWVEVIANQAPQVSGWIKLSPQRPFSFWLWYYYFDAVVKAKKAVFFITPAHSDILYQSNFKSLAALKNVFQLEDAVLYPEKLQGAYMLIRTGQAVGCKTSPVPQFEKIEPIHAWVKWLQNDGRPKVFQYFPPHCEG